MHTNMFCLVLQNETFRITVPYQINCSKNFKNYILSESLKLRKFKKFQNFEKKN